MGEEGKTMLRCKSIIVALGVFIALGIVSDVQGIVPPEVIKGQYIIMLRSGRGIPPGFDEAVSRAGGRVVNTVPEIGMVVATSEEDGFADKVSKSKSVNYVIPDLKVKWVPDKGDMHTQEATAGDGFLYPFQWNMPAISAPEAWSAGHTGAGVRVADLDTGITPDHPDLFPNIDFAASISFVPSEPFIHDLDGHGTWTAGIIAANGSVGVIGVAPEATIIAVKVLDSTGTGDFSWVIAGIVYAAAFADADVINMSLSAYFPKSGHDPDGPFHAMYAAYYLSLFNMAVNFAAQQGATVICAAGNDAINLNHDKEWVVLPADAGNAMAVSATGPIDQKDFDRPASYTNYGTSVIDVAAPGGDSELFPDSEWWLDMVLSTWPGGWAWTDGTSASSAHVSGVAALVIGQHGGEMSPAKVKAIIEQSADDLGKRGMDDYYGRGRINAYKAVAGIKKAPDIDRPRVRPVGKLATTWSAIRNPH